MGYDKQQVAQEFTSWSESYDRSILQWLLFGPSHRVLIRRIREAAAVTGRSRCWMWVAARACLHPRSGRALPQVEVCGVDLVSDMLKKGQAAVATASRTRFAGSGGQRAPAVRVGIIRHRDLRE